MNCIQASQSELGPVQLYWTTQEEFLFWKTEFKESDDPSGFQRRALVGVVNRGGAIGGDGKNGIRITRTVWNLHAG